MIQSAVLFVFLIAPWSAWAASCCGGGLSLPGMIVGDDQRLFSATTSASQLSEESLSTGEWSSYAKPRTSQALHLSLAQVFWDRWQVGASTQVMRNDQSVTGAERSSVEFGDSSFFLGYEALPEWEYSAWRPRGYVFFQVVAPTGRPTTTALQNNGGVTGRGFWTAGPGMILTKIVGRWDVAVSGEIHSSLPKVDNQLRLVPEPGGSVMLGSGYSLGNYRLSGAMTLNYEGPVRAGDSAGSLQRYVTAVLGGSYSIRDDLSIAVSYSDQTLFGEPINAPLNKSIAVAVSKRWAR